MSTTRITRSATAISERRVAQFQGECHPRVAIVVRETHGLAEVLTVERLPPGLLCLPALDAVGGVQLHAAEDGGDPSSHRAHHATSPAGSRGGRALVLRRFSFHSSLSLQVT